MYTADTCPNAGCRNCLYYKANAFLPNVESTCKRIDHKKIKFATPWFISYTCGEFHIPCGDFVPAHPEYADFKDWTNFTDFWRAYVEAWLPYGNENITVGFILNNDRSVRYQVPLSKFIDGTMIADGRLQAVEKMYYKRGAVEHGVQLYKLIHEKINGIPIDICTKY